MTNGQLSCIRPQSGRFGGGRSLVCLLLCSWPFCGDNVRCSLLCVSPWCVEECISMMLWCEARCCNQAAPRAKSRSTTSGFEASTLEAMSQTSVIPLSKHSLWSSASCPLRVSARLCGLNHHQPSPPQHNHSNRMRQWLLMSCLEPSAQAPEV
jgi:hypothetical protein